MPPRYTYWTIIIDGKATAFRARDREELAPTFTQLARTNSDIAMKFFARGKLWDTPEQAQWASDRVPPLSERRNRDWRPGGTHQDPRARFEAKSDRKSEKRAERKPGPRRPHEIDPPVLPPAPETPGKLLKTPPTRPAAPVVDTKAPPQDKTRMRDRGPDRPLPSAGWQPPSDNKRPPRQPFDQRPAAKSEWRGSGRDDRPKPTTAWRDRPKSGWKPRDDQRGARRPFEGRRDDGDRERPLPPIERRRDDAPRERPRKPFDKRPHDAPRGDQRKPFEGRRDGGDRDRPRPPIEGRRDDSAREGHRKPFDKRPYAAPRGDQRKPFDNRSREPRGSAPGKPFDTRPPAGPKRFGDRPRPDDRRKPEGTWRSKDGDRPKPQGAWKPREERGKPPGGAPKSSWRPRDDRDRPRPDGRDRKPRKPR